MEFKKTSDNTVINKVFFVGSKDLGHTIMEELYSIDSDSLGRIITIDDTEDKRSCYSRFKSFAKHKNIPINVLKKPSELSKLVQEEKPDLVVVVGWYWIIPSDVLDKVPYGLIGLHASLLPQYRGFAPLVWAIINGEKKTGISLFYLSKGIDTGDIIDQRELTIGENSKILSLLEKTKKLSLDMIKSNYKDIIKGENQRKVQSKSNTSYCSIRKPEDGLINWSDKNTNIHNFIRAQSDPYPGAFTYIKEKKYYLLDSKVIKDPYYGPNGVIAKKDDKSIIVCCGKNALEITKIREENSKENVVSKMKFGSKFECKK